MSKTSISTENFAMTRWCPMATEESRLAFRGEDCEDIDVEDWSCCIGSLCGCWLTIGNPDNEIGRCGLVKV